MSSDLLSRLKARAVGQPERDRAKAIGYYTKLVELWKSADAELQPRVQEVRDKLARLRRQGG